MYFYENMTLNEVVKGKNEFQDFVLQKKKKKKEEWIFSKATAAPFVAIFATDQSFSSKSTLKTFPVFFLSKCGPYDS